MFTRSTELALASLIYLAAREHEGPISPRQIAEVLQVSPSYLAKIFTGLAKAGILRSRHGALGGVTLTRDPATITLLDVVTQFQWPAIAQDPPAADGAEAACPLHRVLSEVRAGLREALRSRTLAEIAASSCPVGPDCEPPSCHIAEFCPKRLHGAARPTWGSRT